MLPELGRPWTGSTSWACPLCNSIALDWKQSDPGTEMSPQFTALRPVAGADVDVGSTVEVGAVAGSTVEVEGVLVTVVFVVDDAAVGLCGDPPHAGTNATSNNAATDRRTETVILTTTVLLLSSVERSISRP